MKSYTFRLEQALHWRETQVNLQKSRVGAVAGQLAGIQAILQARRSELASAGSRIADKPTGAALASYAGFKQKSLARIRDSEAQALAVQRTLTLEMNRLIEANRKVRLLENLKRTGQDRWRREFDRELAAFADEAFLCGLQSKKRAVTIDERIVRLTERHEALTESDVHPLARIAENRDRRITDIERGPA